MTACGFGAALKLRCRVWGSAEGVIYLYRNISTGLGPAEGSLPPPLAPGGGIYLSLWHSCALETCSCSMPSAHWAPNPFAGCLQCRASTRAEHSGTPGVVLRGEHLQLQVPGKLG